jgi:partner of Y14 and mago protein
MPSVPTKSGIVEAPTGERHIPSSLRPDGSKRKEIKIRPGYKPPEDVEVYKNRAADGFRNRGKYGVPGAEGYGEENKGNEGGEGTAASNKNAKRREARKKAAAEAAANGEASPKSATGALAKDNWRSSSPSEPSSQPASSTPAQAELPVDPEVEREKKARNLKKKLKQAKELKDKKEGGAALLPEQFAKVIKINELIRELDALGFDSDGEPKKKDGEKKAVDA